MSEPVKHSPRGPKPPTWHAAFLNMLPAIERHARIAFRERNPEQREELIQATIVNCLAAFTRLVDRGKVDAAFATPLAAYAVRQVRQGRQTGTRSNVCDVSSGYCQITKGVAMKRLDHFDREEDGWMEILVEDRRAGPAETAAIRIDYAQWLKTLRRRERRIAMTLALGESTGKVARQFGLSIGRISQLRRELEHSWRSFHGEAA